jgi:hypothetical protein
MFYIHTYTDILTYIHTYVHAQQGRSLIQEALQQKHRRAAAFLQHTKGMSRDEASLYAKELLRAHRYKDPDAEDLPGSQQGSEEGREQEDQDNGLGYGDDVDHDPAGRDSDPGKDPGYGGIVTAGKEEYNGDQGVYGDANVEGDGLGTHEGRVSISEDEMMVDHPEAR